MHVIHNKLTHLTRYSYDTHLASWANCEETKEFRDHMAMRLCGNLRAPNKFKYS